MSGGWRLVQPNWAALSVNTKVGAYCSGGEVNLVNLRSKKEKLIYCYNHFKQEIYKAFYAYITHIMYVNKLEFSVLRFFYIKALREKRKMYQESLVLIIYNHYFESMYFTVTALGEGEGVVHAICIENL